MCIRQLFRHFVVAKRKQIREHNRDVTLAYYVQVMNMATYSKDGKNRKAPDLKKFLWSETTEPTTRKQRQSALKNALFTLAGQYGGRVRQVTT